MNDDLVQALNVLHRGPSDEAFPSGHLSPEGRERLLKWYNGNPFDAQEDTVNQALTILQWCQESSGIFQYPTAMRRSIMKTASESLEIPVNRLTDLMVNSNTVLGPSEITRLIAFEGIDASENTRQLNLLKEFLLLQQASVTVLSCLDYREFFGREIARLRSDNDIARAAHLDPKSMALWYALDRKTSVSHICTEDPNGFVLLNRYTLSNVVHQSVRSKVDLEDWIFQLEHTHLGIPAPDLYIVLDTSPTVSRANVSERGRKDWAGPGLDVNEESMTLLTAARQRYRAITTRYSQIQLIECMVDEQEMKTPDQIHAEVLSCLQRHHLLPTIASEMNSRR